MTHNSNIFKKKYLVFFLVVLLLPLLALWYAYYEARNIKVKKMVFSSPDIPMSFVGKKIVFISDIHVNQYFTDKDVFSLVDKINKSNPDIIILGGDYTKKEVEFFSSFFKGMKNLNSSHGVYSVLGNHDHWEDKHLIQQGLIDCGFNICDNRSYWIKSGNDSIKIGGVGDFWEDNQLLGNTISDVKDSDFCILLSHNPDYMENLNTDLVDLVLSGHTHGGQITLFGLWAPIMPSTFHSEYIQTGKKYRYGWKKKGNTELYVTSGVGVGDFPLRFFAAPEIVEITLQRD